MKIKKIYIALSFVAIVFSLASCSDALNVAPDGRISLDQIFSDNDKVSAYLNTCYSNLPFGGIRYFFVTRGPVTWSDDAWDGDDIDVNWASASRLYNGDVSAASSKTDPRNVILDQGGDREYDFWNRYWSSIRSCTLFLNRIGTATVKNESDRKRWAGEAHALRAFYYSELLKWFGCSLPIETKTFDLSSFDFSKTKKSSYHDVVEFITQDCDSALNTTDIPWRIISGNSTQGEGGRVTKALAEAIKSRMTVFAASDLYNGGNNYWDEAYKVNLAARNSLKANGYELYHAVNVPSVYSSKDAYLPNKYAALYSEYFTNQDMQYTFDPIDKETIYQSRDGQGGLWNIDGLAQDGYKVGTCPSQELVDAFETTDGQPILNLQSPYKDEKHIQPNYNTSNTTYDPANPYANRDPRFYADIYYNGSKRKCWWAYDEVQGCIENYPGTKGNRVRTIATWNGEPMTGIDQTKRYATRTGYYIRKFLHPFCGDDYSVGAPCFKYYRLAEVTLNFAEAAAMTGAHDAEAIAAVNEIRDRVGMPPLPSNIGHEELIRRIKNERRVEFAMEGNRYFDVRRWTKPTGDLSATDKWVGAMDITRNADGTFTYNRRPVRAAERKCYTNKFLKVPLDASEANVMHSLTGEVWQNPGW